MSQGGRSTLASRFFPEMGLFTLKIFGTQILILLEIKKLSYEVKFYHRPRLRSSCAAACKLTAALPKFVPGSHTSFLVPKLSLGTRKPGTHLCNRVLSQAGEVAFKVIPTPVQRIFIKGRQLRSMAHPASGLPRPATTFSQRLIIKE
jgi:hypothetical protein